MLPEMIKNELDKIVEDFKNSTIEEINEEFEQDETLKKLYTYPQSNKFKVYDFDEVLSSAYCETDDSDPLMEWYESTPLKEIRSECVEYLTEKSDNEDFIAYAELIFDPKFIKTNIILSEE